MFYYFAFHYYIAMFVSFLPKVGKYSWAILYIHLIHCLYFDRWLLKADLNAIVTDMLLTHHKKGQWLIFLLLLAKLHLCHVCYRPLGDISNALQCMRCPQAWCYDCTIYAPKKGSFATRIWSHHAHGLIWRIFYSFVLFQNIGYYYLIQTGILLPYILLSFGCFITWGFYLNIRITNNVLNLVLIVDL